MKNTIISLLIVLVLVGAFFLGRRSVKPSIMEVRTSDTVVVRDTVRDTVLVPRRIYLTRVDTVVMRIPGDTVEVPVLVPIERKVYATDDYRAVVSGFRPVLDSMEIYRKTEIVTQTVAEQTRARSRWAFGLGIGVCYDPFRNRLSPAVQVGVFIPIWQHRK